MQITKQQAQKIEELVNALINQTEGTGLIAPSFFPMLKTIRGQVMNRFYNLEAGKHKENKNDLTSNN
jgi:hypothetical protein